MVNVHMRFYQRNHWPKYTLLSSTLQLTDQNNSILEEIAIRIMFLLSHFVLYLPHFRNSETRQQIYDYFTITLK